MRVILAYYTGKGLGPWAAADLMIWTKNTRVRMSPSGLDEIAGWTPEKKVEELTYMANTIRSSWEFCDYVFLLEDVTRALTHQLVRHRHGTYAQQTQQILKIDASAVETPAGLNDESRVMWHLAVGEVERAYDAMLEAGATVEQARGILPTNVRTNIVVKFNLRTLTEVIGQRVSPRNLGEFRSVAVKMREAVLDVHPWARVFLQQSRDLYMAELDDILKDIRDDTARGSQASSAIKAMKLVDQLRRNPEAAEDET